MPRHQLAPGEQAGGAPLTARITGVSLDPNDYDDVDIDDLDNPEWTEEDFARARPFREVMGDEFADRWEVNRQRVLAEKAAEAPPQLSAEVIDFYRAQGPGWQARLNADLEELVRLKRRTA